MIEKLGASQQHPQNPSEASGEGCDRDCSGLLSRLLALWNAGQAHTPYHFEVMAGVNNALAEKHVPYVKPRKDWLAGPEGRKADRVCIGRLLQERLLSPPSACPCSPMYFAGALRHVCTRQSCTWQQHPLGAQAVYALMCQLLQGLGIFNRERGVRADACSWQA